MARPTFGSAWGAFMVVQLPIAEVGKKIGGNVQKNIELSAGGFENACPIRMSYVLNMAGFPIQKCSKYAMVSGAGNYQYIYRVGDMMNYLEQMFGKPDKTVKLPKPSDFAAMKGIIVVKGHGWGNAEGHVTLGDGIKCSDSCHLMLGPDNGTFVPEIASIWILN